MAMFGVTGFLVLAGIELGSGFQEPRQVATVSSQNDSSYRSIQTHLEKQEMRKMYVYGLCVGIYAYNRRCLSPHSLPSEGSQE